MSVLYVHRPESGVADEGLESGNGGVCRFTQDLNGIMSCVEGEREESSVSSGFVSFGGDGHGFIKSEDNGSHSKFI